VCWNDQHGHLLDKYTYAIISCANKVVVLICTYVCNVVWSFITVGTYWLLTVLRK
jgi:hypothetical protein